MKTSYLALLMAIIVLTLIYSCKNEQKKHATLIQWIENNKESFKLDGDASEEMVDEEIVNLLEDIARYNNYFDSTGRKNINNS